MHNWKNFSNFAYRKIKKMIIAEPNSNTSLRRPYSTYLTTKITWQQITKVQTAKTPKTMKTKATTRERVNAAVTTARANALTESEAAAAKTKDAIAYAIKHEQHEILCEAAKIISDRAHMIDNVVMSEEAYNILKWASHESYVRLTFKRRQLLNMAAAYHTSAGLIYDIAAKL